MGYRCDWYITTDPPIKGWSSESDWDDEDEEIEPNPPVPDGWSGMWIEFDDDGTFEIGDWKWYEVEQDMILLSRDSFPGVLFHVECGHPDNGGVRHFYFRDGKSYSWRPKRPVAPPFDPSKLQ